MICSSQILILVRGGQRGSSERGIREGGQRRGQRGVKEGGQRGVREGLRGFIHYIKYGDVSLDYMVITYYLIIIFYFIILFT